MRQLYRSDTPMNLPAPKYFLMIIVSLATRPALADVAIEIDDAWIPEAPPVSTVMAAYMEIDNESTHQRQATAVACREFERAEFHRTVEQDGIASMQHQARLTIPADSELQLEPGGYHLMLFNPARRLLAGESTDCTMTFDDGTMVKFELKIKKASAEDHSHHHHH